MTTFPIRTIFKNLIVAMTVGAFVLMSLDSQSLSEGPFSLSRIYKLNPIQNDVATGNNATDWDGVEVYYTNGAVCDFLLLPGSAFDVLDADQHVWPTALVVHVELCALIIRPLKALERRRPAGGLVQPIGFCPQRFLDGQID